MKKIINIFLLLALVAGIAVPQQSSNAYTYPVTLLAGSGGAPVFTANPSLKGIPFSGGIIETNNGTITGATSVNCTFKLDNVTVPGETDCSYPPVVADENKTAEMIVNATNSFGTTSVSAGTIPIGRSSVSFNATTNPTVALNQNFIASDVDTAGDKVNITGLPLDYVSDSEWTKFYVSNTGGALPAPLVSGTPYFIKNVSGGFKFYKVATNADYASFASYFNGETVPPAAFAMFDIPIDITSTGSGTHRVYSNPLIAQIADISGNGTGSTKTQYNSMFEVITDSGQKYIRLDGPIGYKLSQVSEPYYGKGAIPTTNGLASGQKRQGQRFLGQILKGKVYVPHAFNQHRAFLVPSMVNAGTGLFTVTSSNGHGMTTGDKVTYGAIGSVGGVASAFPTGIGSGDRWVRSVSASTFKLYPTKADSQADTNAITYSNTGSGNFFVSDVTRVVRFARQIITDVNQSSNDHYFSPQTNTISRNFDMGSTAYNIGAAFGPSYNGELPRDFLLPEGNVGNAWTVLKVGIFLPSGSVGWMRSDTNAPLPTGTYWATQSPSAPSFFRIHATEAAAIASVGVNTSSCTQCIKYVLTPTNASALGSGDALIYVMDKTVYKPFDDGFTVTGNGYVFMDSGASGVFNTYVDFTGNGTNRLLYSGRNSLNNYFNGAIWSNKTSGVVINGTAQSAILTGDAAEFHVASQADIQRLLIVMGSDPTIFTQQMQMANDYLQ